MWLLKNNNNGKLIYLKPNVTMTVGRNKGEIVLPEDGSISRVHAQITVTSAPNFDQITERSQPLSVCTIKDAGSKYGNFILNDETPVQLTREPYKLKHMDVVRFGLQNYIFTVHYIPMITATSGMSVKDKASLEKLMNSIDGKITNVWIPLCTHMTVEKPIISEKLSCALATQTPIVTMDYWNSVVQAIEKNDELPNPEEFASLIDNKMREIGNISVRPNIARKTLFENLTFLIFSAKQYALYSRMIKLAGGKAVYYGRIRSNPDVRDDNVIVVQYIESNTTQATNTGDAHYAAVCEKLSECRRRAIPESEIAIAIIHCSTKKYCNPNYDYAELFATRKSANDESENALAILALDTQEVDPPSISRRDLANKPIGGKLPKENEWPNCIPESVEQSDDVSPHRARQSRENVTNDSSEESVNKNRRGETAKSSANLDHSAWESQPSYSEMESMKLASLNHDKYVCEELKRKTSIVEITTKRRRDNEDDSTDEINKKKTCAGTSSTDKSDKLEEKRSTGSDKPWEDIVLDDDDFFSMDDDVNVVEKASKEKEEKVNEINRSPVERRSKEVVVEKKRRRPDEIIDLCLDDDDSSSKLVSSENIGSDDSVANDDENPRKRKVGRSYITPFSDVTENPFKRKKSDSSNDERKKIANPVLPIKKTSMGSTASSSSEHCKKMNDNEEDVWMMSASMVPLRSDGETSVRNDKSRTSSTRDYTHDFIVLPNDPNSTMIPLLRIKSQADAFTEGGPKFGKTFRKQRVIIPARIDLDPSTMIDY